MVWHKYLKIACRIIFRVTFLGSEKCEPFKLRKSRSLNAEIWEMRKRKQFFWLFSFLLFFSFSSSQYLVTFFFLSRLIINNLNIKFNFIHNGQKQDLGQTSQVNDSFLHMCGYMVCKRSHVYVCMFICASAWVYVHMCEYVYVVCLCVFMFTCVNVVCVPVHICEYVCECIHAHT